MEDITLMNTCKDRNQSYSGSSKSFVTSNEIHADENNFNSKKSVLGLNYYEESSRFSDKPKNETPAKDSK
ncbi:MAG TPA: hypothetical protein PKW98_05795 [Candidatus Wallbacteria bacterium]|nr:MAG: hypothetical protein BWY32_01872 [bacterium ADurb.Bin243]HPG57309.1 hypothetical protein [Candidatus Wallbacteria bacterium]